MYLSKLPKVKSFYPKKHSSEWPLLKVFKVNDCDQISILDFVHFSGKQEDNQFLKLLSNLKSLRIRSKDMKMMTRQHSELFSNLEWLTLTGFDGDESAAAAFPSNFLYALHNLDELTIEKSSLGEIFPYEEGQEEILSPSLLPHLAGLWLENMSELKYICTQNSPFFSILNQLKSLWVKECPRLTNLVPTGSLPFKFLKGLTVWDCDGLINLIPSSTAASLEQLQMLRIRGCSMIEEIVAADDSQQDHHHIILFPNLKHLTFVGLPRLTSFCTANNYTFKFPELVDVTITKCSNMRTFSPGITITPILERVVIEENRHWKGDLNTTIQEIRTCVDATKSSAKGKEKIQISEEEPNYQDQASSSSTSTITFYEQSSVPTEQQSEKSQETVPSSLSPANEPEEQTNAGSNSLLNEEQETKGLATTDPSTSRKQTEICEGETWKHPRLKSNIEATNSQPINKDFIPLLNKVTQILQTQPLNSMSAQQVQFMEDAFWDLSTMKFSIEWFSPFIEKARDCVSVAEREREITEFELKIAETKALLQALEENKKALEDKNSAIASGMDLGKSVYDN